MTRHDRHRRPPAPQEPTIVGQLTLTGSGPIRTAASPHRVDYTGPTRHRIPGPGTDYTRIRQALLDGWTCGTTMLGWHIPRYAARIHDLRRLEPDLNVQRRRCQHPDHHHDSTQYEWHATRRSPHA